MVHNISGLLISLKQMHEMASYLSQKPVTELIEAYQICREEALLAGCLLTIHKIQIQRKPASYWYYMNTPWKRR